jgi:hypothetical protein
MILHSLLNLEYGKNLKRDVLLMKNFLLPEIIYPNTVPSIIIMLIIMLILPSIREILRFVNKCVNSLKFLQAMLKFANRKLKSGELV